MIKRVLKFFIKTYSFLISPFLGRNCRFFPTCSAYAYEAIDRHGALKGVCLSIKRILKCHPWCRCNMHDPVPKRFTWGGVFGYKSSGN